MTRFLFVLPRFHTNVVPWVRILRENGHHVAIHVTHRGPTENHDAVQPTLPEASALSRIAMAWSRNDEAALMRRTPSLRSYATMIRTENPDIVIVRGLTRWFSRTAAVTALMQRRRLVIYDQEDANPRAWSTWLRRAVLAACGVPHVTTRVPRAGEAVSRFGQAIVLPFGRMHARLVPRDPSGTGPKRILMVAKYRARKGHSMLLQALARVPDGLDFRLTFCGEESRQSDSDFCTALALEADNLGLGSRLAFRNNVAHHMMDSLFAQHDIFVLPSISEPAAVSPIEAAWKGCDVLLSSTSGTRGYIPEGEDHEFNPLDCADLAKALTRSLTADPSIGARVQAHIAALADDDIIMRVFSSLAVTDNRAGCRPKEVV